MRNNKSNIIIFIVLNFILIFILNIFFRNILDFNANLRNFLIHGKFLIRELDNNGIPISYNPKMKESFISPFYVVHYGLIYSEKIENIKKLELRNKYPYIWNDDPSLKFWYNFPKNNKIEFFKNCADYIVNNLILYQGKYHLLNNFDWKYEKMAYKVLKKPWWSGLTDAYSILLLLRAYTYYGDEKYLSAAEKLYDSAITDINKGGSLTYLDGFEWIEEYVNWRFPELNSYVLNGAVYAYYGIYAYEKYYNIKNYISDKLLLSLIYNLPKFDLGFWSYYDNIKDIADVKYHSINWILSKDLLYRFKFLKFNEKFINYSNIENIIKRWEVGVKFPILWLIYSDWPISKLHIILEIIFSEFFILFFVLLKLKGIRNANIKK